MSELTERQQLAYTAMSQMGAKGPTGEWVTAGAVAWRLNLPRVIRHGNGAVKGTWSGLVDPSFVLASTLSGLVRRGLAERMTDRGPRMKYVYRLTR